MRSSSKFFDVALFLSSSLVIGASFISLLSLVLDLSEFSFMRNWPEIRKSEIPQSEFCPISGDWNQLQIPNLARMCLVRCYWMLQNSKMGYSFDHFWVIKGKPTGRGNDKIAPLLYPSPWLRLSVLSVNTQSRYHACAV